MESRTLDAMMDTSDGGFAITLDQRIVRWNEAMEVITGRRAEDVIGKRCYEVLGGRDTSGNRFCCEGCRVSSMAARGEGPSHYDLLLPTTNGGAKWLSISILLVRSDSNRVSSVVHLVRDVTPNMESYL